ncbi:hypothetical protein MW887_004080 [Aspergillus wentii]|nr:hypothetical protein MW887_004080 [Aspergillus wentii]
MEEDSPMPDTSLDDLAVADPSYEEYDGTYRSREVPIEDYKHTMEALEDEVNRFMIEKCKVDACVDWFFECLPKDLPSRVDQFWRYSSHPDFNLFTGEDAEKLNSALAELRTNLHRLVPGYLDDGMDILENQKLKKRITEGWRAWANQTLYNRMSRRKKVVPEERISRSLLDILMEKQYRQRTGTAEHTDTARQAAFNDTCRRLRESIEGEKASALFSCGGTIGIGEAEAGQKVVSQTSSPVSIFWATEKNSTARKVVLPLDSTTQESSADVLQQLVAACDPASFGRGDENVVDPKYRKAGKIDPTQFATSFHPADFGIIENIEQILLPSISTETENKLQFRKLSAELYKLNVYSGPSGLFRKHVDTPRSENQIGSLVVCLPCSFQGGNLIIQHNGRKVDFDWSSQSKLVIQWAAFYSDCEHEIQTITEGHRITLTYNLLMKQQLTDPNFMKEGGVLGFYCSHAYPHTSEVAELQLPRGLKGADLVLYSVLKSLGIEVNVLPVLENDGKYGSANPQLGLSGTVSHKNGRFYMGTYGDYEAYGLKDYLAKGEKLKINYSEIMPQGSVDMSDIDRRWKMLLMVRRVRGMTETFEFAEEKDLPRKSGSFYRTEGSRVAPKLREFETTDRGQEEELDETARDAWPNYYLPGITWINEPKHEEMAFNQIAYGNEASVGTRYSVAAILAVVPPSDQRAVS